MCGHAPAPTLLSSEQMRTFEADMATIYEAFGLDLQTPATGPSGERSRASNAQGAICFCATQSQRRRQPYDQSTFAKVLVRYNPEGDASLNQRQIGRLRHLSDCLHQAQTLFMYELLVPASPRQLEQVEGDTNAYDLQLRPRLMMQTIQALQAAGVEPDVWKVEGLDRQEDCARLVEIARGGGRNSVGLIVLGRGAERGRVVHWLKTAASVPGFIGFAVG